jgi:hypothetical protein
MDTQAESPRVAVRIVSNDASLIEQVAQAVKAAQATLTITSGTAAAIVTGDGGWHIQIIDAELGPAALRPIAEGAHIMVIGDVSASRLNREPLKLHLFDPEQNGALVETLTHLLTRENNTPPVSTPVPSPPRSGLYESVSQSVTPHASEPARRPSGLRDIERELILAAYQDAGGNLVQTARILGIPRTTLRHKLRRYGAR